jgi:hypothetical protein
MDDIWVDGFEFVDQSHEMTYIGYRTDGPAGWPEEELCPMREVFCEIRWSFIPHAMNDDVIYFSIS